ncbi:hypothetical protein NXS08_04365 [Gleimia sp. 6138-11-ORH1]|uniref:PASTA domain-containing protein n=1 Tax=Gleimia sp. 6138-11-ORH1 TaxID=2973937 RepID=UPI002169D40C|nr:Stk1 family PASTA domain-containing Ser/Thr kinase [Gleimia sp. 6138-11-ORH1]MCS4484716.1 hypothetical protein [Gleimia sp. 6138-11-ORH1]
MGERFKKADWADYIIMAFSALVALGILFWVLQTNRTVEADRAVVPDVRWLSIAEAKEVLSAAGFQQFEFTAQGSGKFLGAKDGWYTRQPEAWVIVKQVPSPGDKASVTGANLHFFAFQDGSIQLKRAKIAEGVE